MMRAWWSQKCSSQPAAALGDDNDDVEERDENDDDKRTFRRGCWAVKESESYQDQDDVIQKWLDIKDQENCGRKQDDNFVNSVKKTVKTGG